MKPTLQYLIVLLTLVLAIACTKSTDSITPTMGGGGTVVTPPTIPSFITYTIKKGLQFADLNSFQAVSYTEQKFIVVFDSSAKYQTIDPSNQGDINKLYGFADNDSLHHSFSARFGWNWINNSLWLYAYVYNNRVIQSQALTTIPLNQEATCSIKVNSSNYVFTVNGNAVTVHRASKTATGKGYKLYPYFGGDETAPHEIKVMIKEL